LECDERAVIVPVINIYPQAENLAAGVHPVRVIVYVPVILLEVEVEVDVLVEVVVM